MLLLYLKCTQCRLQFSYLHPPLEADEVSGVVMAAHHCYV
jgi:hypothetical protein